MLKPCQCICGEAGRLKTHGGWFYVDCPRGHKGSMGHTEEQAILAWAELNPSGRPTKLLIRYSLLNNWSKMQDDWVIAIHALEYCDKRNGYIISLSWL